MKVELLAPAGNFDKLKCALYFGADAVYVGGKDFSLRAFAANFSREDIALAAKYCHNSGKKIYVAANVFAKNADFALLEDYFKFLESAGADGVIVSDAGAVYLAKKVAPRLNIHISTQANLTNKYAVKFWREQGATRAVLARELSLEEIAGIHDFVPEMELEAFVHGAMCISYSGRCLLSNYLAGRESNRGECVQACRWNYQIRKLDGGEWLDIEEDGRGTYILNSKDLNMSRHIDKMLAAGVSSLKIEGRMKSEYYVATVVNAYRRCIDGGFSPVVDKELKTAFHRDYTEAYAFGDNAETVNYADSQAKGDCEYIGNVLGSDGKFVTVEMRTRFKKGDILEVLSPSENFGKSFEVGRALLPDGEETDDCKLVQEKYRIECDLPLAAGDILRRRKI